MRARLSGWLTGRVRSVLRERQVVLEQAQARLERVEPDVAGLEARLIALRRGLDAAGADLTLASEPFSPQMTIDQAWRKHPHTRRVFATHHLPACDGCAVRFDETLEEAAEAYGLDLAGLLAALNGLR